WPGGRGGRRRSCRGSARREEAARPRAAGGESPASARPISQRRRREKLAVELGQALARAAGFVGVRVVLDELPEREAGVGRVAHVDEEVALLPQRRRRLATARVLGDDVVELGDGLVLVALQRVAPRDPVERVRRERGVLVLRGVRVQLSDGPAAVLLGYRIEHGRHLGLVGCVAGGDGLLIAGHVARPAVLGRGGGRSRRRNVARSRRDRRRHVMGRRLGERRRAFARRTSLETVEAILELLDALVGRPAALAATLPRPAFDVATQPLDLALDRLDLLPL